MIHALLAIAMVLTLVSLLVPLAERLRLPHTVLLAIAGMGLGFLGTWIIAQRPQLRRRWATSSPASTGSRSATDVFLPLFLPPLLFTAGLTIDVRRLFDEVFAVLLLAIVAVLVCIAVVAGVGASRDRHGHRGLPAAGRGRLDHRSGGGDRHLPRRRRAQAAVDPGRGRIAVQRRGRHRRVRLLHHLRAAPGRRSGRRPVGVRRRDQPAGRLRCASSWAASCSASAWRAWRCWSCRGWAIRTPPSPRSR